MAIRYLFIPKEHEQQTRESVDLLPVDVQIDMADYEVTPEQLAEYFSIVTGNQTTDYLNPIRTEKEFIERKFDESYIKHAHDVVKAISSADYFIVTYDDNIYDAGMGEDDSVALSLNNEVLVYVKRNDVGYSVDVYNQKQQNDEGLFGSIQVFDEDLN